MNALVTGGGGFLGGAIVRQLLGRGDRVRSYSRGLYPELDALGVEQHQGDLAQLEPLVRAAEGCDIVFHVAAKAGIWGPYAEYHRANVVGTQNVLEACRRNRIARLLYTSSPSVVFDGRDMANVDESVPYPGHYDTHYPKTKAEAERLVLQANGPDLATVSLRPHLIWGPGDHHLIPRIIARAKAGKLRRVGDGTNLVDSIYIDNAAEAHVLAAGRLQPGSPVAGRAYFISQGEPRPLWALINDILRAAGVPPVTRSISPGMAYFAGTILEIVYHVFRLSGEPMMTRFLARELSTSHWFNVSASRRDLGFTPRVSIDEGLKRLSLYFQNLSGHG